jgi:hypothetical protein
VEAAGSVNHDTGRYALPGAGNHTDHPPVVGAENPRRSHAQPHLDAELGRPLPQAPVEGPAPDLKPPPDAGVVAAERHEAPVTDGIDPMALMAREGRGRQQIARA